MRRDTLLEFLSSKAGHRVDRVELLKVLGISYNGLKKKLLRERDFSVSEICRIKEHYGLTDAETMDWLVYRERVK